MRKIKLNHKRFQIDYIILLIILIIAMIIAVFPVVIAILYSFRPTSEYAALPTWISRATLEHYRSVFIDKAFTKYAYRSLIVTISSIALSIFIGLPAAFGFARYSFKAKNFLINWILSTWMLPPIVAVIPLFIIIRSLHLYDKLITLIILYSVMNMVLVIWIMVEFFRQIPKEVEEAAMLDGCNEFMIFLKINLPLVTPGLIATAILCFIFSWNEFLFANVFTGPFARTITVGTTEFVTSIGIQWGDMFATLSVMIIPPIIFVLLTRKYLIRGFLSFGNG